MRGIYYLRQQAKLKFWKNRLPKGVPKQLFGPRFSPRLIALSEPIFQAKCVRGCQIQSFQKHQRQEIRVFCTLQNQIGR